MYLLENGHRLRVWQVRADGTSDMGSPIPSNNYTAEQSPVRVHIKLGSFGANVHELLQGWWQPALAKRNRQSCTMINSRL
jgi:hypothetical protein